MIKVEIEKKSNFPKAQEFYSSVEYFSKIQPEDIVFSAYEGGRIIGVVRIAEEHDVLVLRGMMVATAFQRKGVGTLMIKELEKAIGDRDCYCIPHDWLQGFYGQVGFTQIDSTQAPPHLEQRIKEYRRQYPDLIMMKRNARSE